MPSTGETCTETGNYTGRCKNGHTAQAHFTKGDTFTACQHCGGSSTPGGAVMNWQKTS